MVASSGCTSLLKDPEQNWYRLSNDGPVSAWAVCINEQSHKWLDAPEANPDWIRLNVSENDAVPDVRLFTVVMADCGELMTGSGWDSMADSKKIKIISDAFLQFKRIELNVVASKQSPVT